MTATPTEFFAAYRLFRAFEIRATSDQWGMLTDGFADMSEVIEGIVSSFDAAIPSLINCKVVKIDLAEGTARDVTEDVLASITAMQEAAE